MLGNQTKLAEFILLGFRKFYELQTLLFLIFLVIYVVTITGNILTFALIVFDRHLHTPMYFFLGNLSFLEACSSSNIFPQMLLALITGDRRISFTGCFTQWYLFGSLEAAECFLLCAMSYDRYLAICKPLHYATTMKTHTSIHLAAASWFSGFIACLVLLILMLQLSFCGPSEIDHYFCEYFPLLKLSCSDTSVLEITRYILAVIFTFPPFFLTITSYVYIIAAILKIPSAAGRQKAFSTCSSHLIVVSIFYGTLMIAYMIPKSKKNREMQKISSLLYTALSPLVNPFIYSLRNKEVKNSLRNNIRKLVR
ncbi:olfactory receptor 6C4-like [Zootoca vivipara]|uniref:olfactory receptor 6C4-like n=1 Tax=Zootoca vivipara TaxID=8524 RepID=UPI0015917303|nr:olfactory receptor 6C4-like [Zootoca vivipara]